MEDLQSLLEKINRDGVEKADAEAKRIVDAAKAKADALMKDAEEKVARAKADAERASAAYEARARESLAQAARDVVLGVRDAVTALLERILAKDVDRALADEATAAALAAEAIRGLSAGEITCGPKLAETLRAQLANGAFTVATDANADAGFTVKTEGGRVEHTFTAEAISNELAKRLRPDLAALLK